MTGHTDDKMEPLLRALAAKLGVDPEALRAQLSKGNASGLGLPPDQAAALERALGDPRVRQQVLSSPQAQAILRKLNGGR